MHARMQPLVRAGPRTHSPKQAPLAVAHAPCGRQSPKGLELPDLPLQRRDARDVALDYVQSRQRRHHHPALGHGQGGPASLRAARRRRTRARGAPAAAAALLLQLLLVVRGLAQRCRGRVLHGQQVGLRLGRVPLVRHGRHLGLQLLLQVRTTVWVRVCVCLWSRGGEEEGRVRWAGCRARTCVQVSSLSFFRQVQVCGRWPTQ